MCRQFALIPLIIISNAIAHADDVYLKNGFVFRSVCIIDTTGSSLNLVLDDHTVAVEIESIARVEKLDVVSGRKPSYEMYSQEMYEKSRPIQLEKDKREQSRVSSKNVDSTWSICTSSGVSHSELRLLRLIDDTLVVLQRNQPINVSIRAIRELRLVREGRVLKGLIIGTGVGALAGLPGLIESRNYSDFLFFITTPVGALVGVLFGAAAGTDYVCNFEGMEITDRVSTVRQILLDKFP